MAEFRQVAFTNNAVIGSLNPAIQDSAFLKIADKGKTFEIQNQSDYRLKVTVASLPVSRTNIDIYPHKIVEPYQSFRYCIPEDATLATWGVYDRGGYGKLVANEELK